MDLVLARQQVVPQVREHQMDLQAQLVQQRAVRRKDQRPLVRQPERVPRQVRRMDRRLQVLVQLRVRALRRVHRTGRLQQVRAQRPVQLVDCRMDRLLQVQALLLVERLVGYQTDRREPPLALGPAQLVHCRMDRPGPVRLVQQLVQQREDCRMDQQAELALRVPLERQVHCQKDQPEQLARVPEQQAQQRVLERPVQRLAEQVHCQMDQPEEPALVAPQVVQLQVDWQAVHCRMDRHWLAWLARPVWLARQAWPVPLV